MNVIEELEKEQLRDDIPDFKPGDTVRLSVRVVEGGKERIQQYEGVVIKRQNSGIRETFTVRRVSWCWCGENFPGTFSSFGQNPGYAPRQGAQSQTVLSA